MRIHMRIHMRIYCNVYTYTYMYVYVCVYIQYAFLRNGAKRCEMGRNGAKRGETGPNGATGTPNFRNKVSTYLHNKNPLQPSCWGMYIQRICISICVHSTCVFVKWGEMGRNGAKWGQGNTKISQQYINLLTE